MASRNRPRDGAEAGNRPPAISRDADGAGRVSQDGQAVTPPGECLGKGTPRRPRQLGEDNRFEHTLT
jgi:hypothetical protein